MVITKDIGGYARGDQRRSLALLQVIVVYNHRRHCAFIKSALWYSAQVRYYVCGDHERHCAFLMCILHRSLIDHSHVFLKCIVDRRSLIV